MSYNLIIGFDPSFQTMGIAWKDLKTDKLYLDSGDFDYCFGVFKQLKAKADCVCFIENPNLDKPAFKMLGMIEEAILKRSSMQHVRSKVSIALNFAQKVGENKAAAKYLIQKLRDSKAPVIEIAPSKRQKAFAKIKGKKVLKDPRFLKMPTKTTVKQFLQLTGINGRSSEHARDAATLIHAIDSRRLENILKMYQISIS